MSSWNEKIIEEFRANEGRGGGMFEGAPLLLLTTTGARTGRPHTTPLVCLEDGGRLYVFGTNAGADHHPAWVHNVRANPRVTVERGAEKFQATAVSLDGEERDHVHAEQAAQDPAFAAYQEGTSRRIPVVALTPVSGLGDQLVRIHDGLRRELAVLVSEAADQADRTALTTRFREHCRAYCGNVHEHHINEATRGFPLLLRAFPELTPALETLRAEHDRLAELRAELEKTLDQTDANRLHADLSRLSAELNAHFDREESQLVAALNAL